MQEPDRLAVLCRTVHLSQSSSETLSVLSRSSPCRPDAPASFGLLGKRKEDEGKTPPRTEGGGCEEGKKPGLIDKIKDKIPGQQQKLPGDGKQCCGQRGGEEEKKPGMVDKIKEKLSGHQNKNGVE